MSKATESKKSDTIKEESEGSTQTANEASPSPSLDSQPEQTAVEHPSPKASTASDMDELKAMNRQLIDLVKGQSETIAAQKLELNNLKERFETLNTEYENSKPLDRRAEVVGFFDYGKNKEVYREQKYVDEREYAKKLFADLELEFPSV